MSCYLVEGGLKSIFPLRPTQIDRIQSGCKAVATRRGHRAASLDLRFGAMARPDGRPFYLATWVPATPPTRRWEGGFYTELGPYRLEGLVTADPPSGVMSVAASVSSGGRTVVDVTWRIQGPAVGTTPPNVAGMWLGMRVRKAGPHNVNCLRDCLTLHAPDCVPMKRGNESELVACAAAVAAGCLINCRC